MGGVPREVTPIITPGIDITQFLLLNREVVVGSGTFAAVGGQNIPNTTVPAGELWYVHWVEVRTDIGLPAGSSCRISVATGQFGAGIMVGDPESGVAGEFVTVFSRDLWLSAGSDLRVRVHEVSGGPINFTGVALLTRLRI